MLSQSFDDTEGAETIMSLLCLRDLVMALKLIRIKTRWTTAFKAVHTMVHSPFLYTSPPRQRKPLITPHVLFSQLNFVSWVSLPLLLVPLLAQ